MKSPTVIGHEGAGVVEQVGEGVTDLKVRLPLTRSYPLYHSSQVGDRVALEPAVPCGHCELCKSGEYNLCPEIK